MGGSLSSLDGFLPVAKLHASLEEVGHGSVSMESHLIQVVPIVGLCWQSSWAYTIYNTYNHTPIYIYIQCIYTYIIHDFNQGSDKGGGVVQMVLVDTERNA